MSNYHGNGQLIHSYIYKYIYDNKRNLEEKIFSKIEEKFGSKIEEIFKINKYQYKYYQ